MNAMLIPVIKRAYRLSIKNALKSQKPTRLFHQEYIEKSTSELTIKYAIAGFSINIVYYRFKGIAKIHQDQIKELASLYDFEAENYIEIVENPSFVVTRLEGIVVGSVFDDKTSSTYEECLAGQMASAAHVQLPSTFAIINTSPLYMIPYMEYVDSKNPLIEINNPLKFIEIIKIEGQTLDLDKLRAEVKSQETEWLAHSPFFKQSGLSDRVRQKYT